MYFSVPVDNDGVLVIEKHPERRWPKSVLCCAKCNKKRTEISYGRRGLCISCAQGEISAGSIESWPIIRRGPRGTRSKNAVYKTVTHIGVTDLSVRLGVESEEIRDWLKGYPVPPVYKKIVDNLLIEIRRVSALANRGTREEEFFTYVDTGYRLIDGKTL